MFVYRVHRVELKDFLNDLFDGRIIFHLLRSVRFFISLRNALNLLVHFLMCQLETFKTNPHGINICIVRLLTKLTVIILASLCCKCFKYSFSQRERGRHYKHLVCIFFQLSYFDLFIRILRDKSYRVKSACCLGCCCHSL